MQLLKFRSSALTWSFRESFHCNGGSELWDSWLWAACKAAMSNLYQTWHPGMMSFPMEAHLNRLNKCNVALFREASSATSSVSRLIGICIRLAFVCNSVVGIYLDFVKVSYDHTLVRLFTSWQRQTVHPSLQRKGEAWWILGLATISLGDFGPQHRCVHW